MASERYNCEAENLISEDVTEQIESGYHFVAINDILKREIVEEEPTKTKSFSKYREDNIYLEQSHEETFHKPDSSQLEVMLRENEKDPSISQFISTDVSKNMNFKVEAPDYVFVGENPEDNQFNEELGIKIEKQDYSECSQDFLSNYVDLKTETIKTEDDIDIIHKYVKQEICGEELDEKSENKSYTETSYTHELSKDCGTSVLQNTTNEEDGIDVKWDNDTNKEPTTSNNSKDDQLMQSNDFLSSKLMQETSGKTQTEDKPFQCKSCSKSFTMKKNMLQHERNHTDLLQLNTAIEEDGKYAKMDNSTRITNNSSDQMEQELYERAYTGGKPFQCQICSKSFAYSSVLKLHWMVHTGEKPFQCKICSKSFSQKGAFKLHERVHSGKKPFQCQTCLKTFSKKSSIIYHGRLHTGKLPFQCEICSKSFAVKCVLTNHKKVHARKSLPFQCEICPKLFARKGSLDEHVRVHTGERPFQCKIVRNRLFEKALLYIMKEFM